MAHVVAVTILQFQTSKSAKKNSEAHYENTSLQYTAIFTAVKMKMFTWKISICFLFLLIDCVYVQVRSTS